jgi:hypothetical protein
LNDLDILAPGRELKIAGETLTVREFTFGEQMQHGAVLAELADALRPVLEPNAGGDPLTAILDALAAQAQSVTALIAASIDKPPEWVEALDGDAGEALAITWWTVNKGFFIRRLLRPLQFQAALNSPTAGAASSLPSSATATGNAN